MQGIGKIYIYWQHNKPRQSLHCFRHTAAAVRPCFFSSLYVYLHTWYTFYFTTKLSLSKTNTTVLLTTQSKTRHSPTNIQHPSKHSQPLHTSLSFTFIPSRQYRPSLPPCLFYSVTQKQFYTIFSAHFPHYFDNQSHTFGTFFLL